MKKSAEQISDPGQESPEPRPGGDLLHGGGPAVPAAAAGDDRPGGGGAGRGAGEQPQQPRPGRVRAVRAGAGTVRPPPVTAHQASAGGGRDTPVRALAALSPTSASTSATPTQPGIKILSHSFQLG